MFKAKIDSIDELAKSKGPWKRGTKGKRASEKLQSWINSEPKYRVKKESEGKVKPFEKFLPVSEPFEKSKGPWKRGKMGADTSGVADESKIAELSKKKRDFLTQHGGIDNILKDKEKYNEFHNISHSLFLEMSKRDLHNIHKSVSKSVKINSINELSKSKGPWKRGRKSSNEVYGDKRTPNVSIGKTAFWGKVSSKEFRSPSEAKKFIQSKGYLKYPEGNLKEHPMYKSLDIIEPFEKARSHKYISKKRVGQDWQYKYKEGKTFKMEMPFGLHEPTENEMHHENMRINTMSEKALEARIRKVKDPQKMMAFAYALENQNYHDMAGHAYDALKQMGYDPKGNKIKEQKVKQLVEPFKAKPAEKKSKPTGEKIINYIADKINEVGVDEWNERPLEDRREQEVYWMKQNFDLDNLSPKQIKDLAEHLEDENLHGPAGYFYDMMKFGTALLTPYLQMAGIKKPVAGAKVEYPDQEAQMAGIKKIKKQLPVKGQKLQDKVEADAKKYDHLRNTGRITKQDKGRHIVLVDQEESIPGYGKTYKMAGDISVAQTIGQQMGGFGRIKAMTGAKNFIGLPNGLSFDFPNRKGPNHVKITLDPDDRYTVEFFKKPGMKAMMSGKLDSKKMNTHSGIYFDQLKPLFENETGLRLSL
jgi:hypothetical protein